MKNVLSVCLLLIFTSSLFAQASESKAIQSVRAVLKTQQDAWNRGDIDAFMEYYWKSEQLQFVGSKGPTYGWAATLANYKKNYPNRDAMGTLSFDIQNLTQRSKTIITVLGKYTLVRKNDQPSGEFSLVFQKINGDWVIVLDHTN